MTPLGRLYLLRVLSAPPVFLLGLLLVLPLGAQVRQQENGGALLGWPSIPGVLESSQLCCLLGSLWCSVLSCQDGSSGSSEASESWHPETCSSSCW